MSVNQNYISYSLWGAKPIYNIGMLKNIRQAAEIYPGWQVIVYHDDTVPLQTLIEIQKTGARVVNVTKNIYGMFWRFYAADLPDCGYVIFRDSDSRLSVREKAAVDEWINSGKAIHIMRDHPYHQDPIDNTGYQMLGGMWGIRGGLLNMTELIDNYALNKPLKYGSDQFFLNSIYTMFKDSATIHDEFFSGSKFPVKRKSYRFIGERFDENDQPDPNTWKLVREHYRNKSFRWTAFKTLKNLAKHLIR